MKYIIILTVHISNISDNMLEKKIYGGHFDLFVTMVTGQNTSYKVSLCDHLYICTYII